jgi:hypothetical protein
MQPLSERVLKQLMMFLKESELKFRQFWMLILMLKYLLLKFILRKDVNEMAIIYATLIVKGKKTFAEVPERIKEQVRQVLIDLECEELAVE